MQDMSVSNKTLEDTLNKLTDAEIRALFAVESSLTTNLLCRMSTRELHTFHLDYGEIVLRTDNQRGMR